MSFTDFIFTLADLIQSTFGILESLGNLPNVLVVILGFAGVGLWIKMQADYNKKAEQDGSLK